MREHTIVTISRQYGSGGREVAEILAKKMQVRCFVCLYALFGFPRSAAKNSVRGWYSAKRPRHILYIYGGLARWLY